PSLHSRPAAHALSSELRLCFDLALERGDYSGNCFQLAGSGQAAFPSRGPIRYSGDYRLRGDLCLLACFDCFSPGHSLRAGRSAGKDGRRSRKEFVSALREAFKEFSQYPSAIMGLLIIAALIVLSIYTVIVIPYSEGLRLWRGGEDIWIENPRNARPRWVNVFLKERLPETIIVNTP